MAKSKAQRERAETRSNIRHLKHLAQANPRNHGWEDREITELEKKLKELKVAK